MSGWHRFRVRKTFIPLLFAVAFLAGCNRNRANNTGPETTQTIAPATAQPAAAGTDTAMTQTVEIEDSRSDADGGTSTVTEKTKATKTTKPPVKKKTTKK
jgi:uncharacterized lipoprotein YajG